MNEIRRLNRDGPTSRTNRVPRTIVYQEIKIAQEDDDPYRIPPDFEKAKAYGYRKRVHRRDRRNQEKNRSIPLFGPLSHIYHLGSCFPLYFGFVKFCIIFLALVFFVHGLYALITNFNSNDCANGGIPGCDLNYATKISIINKLLHPEYINAEAWLNLVVVIAMIVAFAFHRRAIRKTTHDVEKVTISSRAYTLMVDNVGPNVTDEELKEFFENVIPGRKTPVAVVNRSHDVGTRVRDTDQIYVLVEKVRLAKTEKEKEDLYDAIEKIEQRIKAADEKGYPLAPVAFIGFEHIRDARDVEAYMADSPYVSVIGFLFGHKKNRSRRFFKDTLLEVCRAPEPNDVLWEHLATPKKTRIKIKLTTFLSAGFLAVACFGSLLGFAYGQQQINNGLNGHKIGILGYVSTFSILVFNFVIHHVAREMLVYERAKTVADYFVSVGEVIAFATFVNIAFSMFFAKVVVVKGGFQSVDVYFAEGGLMSDIFLVFLSNAFITPIRTIIDIRWFQKLCKRRSELKQGIKSQLTQKEANTLFMGHQFNMGVKYGTLVRTILFTSFYAPAAPIATVIGLAGFIMDYWADKYSLSKRLTTPRKMHSELAVGMTNILQFAPFFYALGSMSWFNIIGSGDFLDDQRAIASGIALVLSFVHVCLPNTRLNKKLFTLRDPNAAEPPSYSEAVFYFSSTFGLENPVTKQNEIKQIQALHQKRELQKQTMAKEEYAPKEQQKFFSDAETEEGMIFKHKAFTVVKVEPLDTQHEGEGEALVRDISSPTNMRLDSADFMPDQVEEITRIDVDPDVANEKRLIHAIPDTDLTVMKMRMSKSTFTYKFYTTEPQQQIRVTSLSLKENVRSLLQFISVLETENERLGESGSQEDHLKLKNDALIESCYQFLGKVVEKDGVSCTDKSQLRDMALIEEGIARLDLQNPAEEPFDSERLKQIKEIKEALTELSGQAEEQMKVAGVSNVNRRAVDLPSIKEELVAQNPALQSLPEESLEKLSAVGGIANVSRKIDRDVGAIVQIQGINPVSIEDERHLQPEAENILYTFDPALIRKISPEEMRGKLDGVKRLIKNLDESHRAVETHQQNLLKAAQKGKLSSNEKAQVEKDAQGFNQLNLMMREFKGHLIKLIQSDPSGQKLTEAEEKRLMESAEGITDKQVIQSLARLLAAVELLDLGSTSERATDGMSMKAKLNAIALLKRDANNIISQMEDMFSQHHLEEIDRESEDRKATLEKVVNVAPHVKSDKYWALALSEAVIIRNLFIKYEAEQAAILERQGVNPSRLDDPNLKPSDYFVGHDEDLVTQQALDKLSEYNKQKSLFGVLAINPKALETEEEITTFKKEAEKSCRIGEIAQGMGALQGHILDLVAEHIKDIPQSQKEKSERAQMTQDLDAFVDDQAIRFTFLPKEIQKLYLVRRAAAEGKEITNPPRTLTKEELGEDILMVIRGRAQEKKKLITKIDNLNAERENKSAQRYQSVFGLDLNGSRQGVTRLLQESRSDPQKQQKLIEVLGEIKEEKVKIDLVLCEHGVVELNSQDQAHEEAIKTRLIERDPNLASQPEKLQQLAAQLAVCSAAKAHLSGLEGEIERAVGISSESGSLRQSFILKHHSRQQSKSGVQPSHQRQNQEQEEEKSHSQQIESAPLKETIDTHGKTQQQRNAKHLREDSAQGELVAEIKIEDHANEERSRQRKPIFDQDYDNQHHQALQIKEDASSQFLKPSVDKKADKSLQSDNSVPFLQLDNAASPIHRKSPSFNTKTGGNIKGGVSSRIDQPDSETNGRQSKEEVNGESSDRLQQNTFDSKVVKNFFGSEDEENKQGDRGICPQHDELARQLAIHDQLHTELHSDKSHLNPKLNELERQLALHDQMHSQFHPDKSHLNPTQHISVDINLDASGLGSPTRSVVLRKSIHGRSLL